MSARKKGCLQTKQAGGCNGIVIYLTLLRCTVCELRHHGDAKTPELQHITEIPRCVICRPSSQDVGPARPLSLSVDPRASLVPCFWIDSLFRDYMCVSKDKVLPETGHEGPGVCRCIALLFI
jgi:hypothetical protein